MEKNETIDIRTATVADAKALSVLASRTFTETFGHLYPPEDLQAFLEKSHSQNAWAKTLADPLRRTCVATAASRPIAFITVGACKLPVDTLEAYAGEIQMLYVLSAYQNLKLGARLMEAGLEWLHEQGRTPLYIGVWSENLGAQRFYARYGFRKVGEYGFEVGGTVDREFILKQ